MYVGQRVWYNGGLAHNDPELGTQDFGTVVEIDPEDRFVVVLLDCGYRVAAYEYQMDQYCTEATEGGECAG